VIRQFEKSDDLVKMSLFLSQRVGCLKLDRFTTLHLNTLANNSSITELCISKSLSGIQNFGLWCDSSTNISGIEHILPWLESNTCIRSLEIIGYPNADIKNVLEAAKKHQIIDKLTLGPAGSADASSLFETLQDPSFNFVKKLNFSTCQVSSIFVSSLSDLLRTNASITCVEFGPCMLDERGLNMLFESLSQNSSVVDLKLCDHSLNAVETAAVVKFLQQNVTVRSFELSVDFSYVSAVLDALCGNSTVQDFTLKTPQFLQISVPSLLRVLSSCGSLTKFNLKAFDSYMVSSTLEVELNALKSHLHRIPSKTASYSAKYRYALEFRSDPSSIDEEIVRVATSETVDQLNSGQFTCQKLEVPLAFFSKSMITTLQFNETVRFLRLGTLDPSCVMMLVPIVRHNTSLAHIEFVFRDKVPLCQLGTEHVTKCLADLSNALRQNMTLQRLYIQSPLGFESQLSHKTSLLLLEYAADLEVFFILWSFPHLIN
jgi:hypothetical protein